MVFAIGAAAPLAKHFKKKGMVFKMATKNVYPSNETIELFQDYTRAGAAILEARQTCAALENNAHMEYNAAVNAARDVFQLVLDNVDGRTKGASVRKAALERDAAIDAATKKRDAAIDAARGAFNESVKNARETQTNVLKRVDAGVYAAMLLYNNTGTINAGGYTTEIKVTGKAHAVEKRAIYVEKTLVEAIRNTLCALEFNRVDDVTTERFIRRIIVNAAGTRSRGAAGNYTRRGLTKEGYKREIVEYIIGALVNPRYEYRIERDAETRETREISVTIAPKYHVNAAGDWSRN